MGNRAAVSRERPELAALAQLFELPTQRANMQTRNHWGVFAIVKDPKAEVLEAEAWCWLEHSAILG